MTMNRVQRSGEPGKTVHAARSHKNIDGATRLRRKLSRIFQREIIGSVLRTLRRFASGTVGKIKCKICQSPRVHRCCRLTYASYEAGYSSSSSISVTSAARANDDSKR